MVLMGCFSTGKDAKEALIKADSMKRQCKMVEFKTKVANNSTAIAQIFNAEIVHFGCWGVNHALISASLSGNATRNYHQPRPVIPTGMIRISLATRMTCI